METADTSRLPDELFWLRDAPLFIDRNQVSRFYDALIRPEYDTESIRSSVTEQTARTLAGLLKLSGTAGAEVTIDPGIIANLLSSFFKAEAKATAEASAEAEGNVGRTATKGSGREVVLRPITTPERSLEQLTLHYLLQHPERLFLVADPSEPDWRTPSVVSAVPREVVFLDLPSYSEAGTDRPQTKIIPTAAEFEDGAIVPLFLEFRDKDGCPPPRYPEDPTLSNDKLREQRKVYWAWFDTSFRASTAMRIVEEAASAHGRIRWIDYRVPITSDGDTLHLHLTPGGEYDTGTFAYNLIKRGFTHGLRLIGTLRSEPSMNVLAIYEK